MALAQHQPQFVGGLRRAMPEEPSAIWCRAAMLTSDMPRSIWLSQPTERSMRAASCGMVTPLARRRSRIW
jgi:hypothetical protein